MEFDGTGDRYTVDHVSAVARLLDCEFAAVRAVIDVESAGVGFGADRRPLILFEPHVFYRLLGPGSQRDRAVRVGVAYPRWGARPYPATQRAQYLQLQQAMTIAPVRSLQSASWGIGQTMGFNYQPCGFLNVAAMVEAMRDGEGEQLIAMANFILYLRLDRYLRTKAWASFARGYNGPGYAANRYDTKLAIAYARHAQAAPRTAARGARRITLDLDDETRAAILPK